MELVIWFSIGVLFTVAVFGMTYLSLRVRLKWYTWGSLITGILLILFGIGWAGASFIEGVPQSGAMALMFFCGGGLILMLLTWRYLVAPEFEQSTG